MISPVKILLISLALMVFVVLGIIFIPREYIEDQTSSTSEYPMQISSPSIQTDGAIPTKFTCDGENMNPELQWNAIPERTKSLVLIIEDPDAPVGSWIHWNVWNIDPKSNGVSEGGVPEGGVEGVTSFDTTGYGGPCPRSGEHHYYFKLYALNIELELDSTSNTNDLYAAMDGHLLGETGFMATYSR
ncbi:YbhB/YbcL family Raf kinase inhibitor-like protein [Patescibacteria group bacterium]